MLITHGNREDAIHALINTWLKDPTKSCAYCGKGYNYERFMAEGPCCEQPLINTNHEHMKLFQQELEVIRQTRKNKYGSNDDKTMRMGLSIPAGLYVFLDKAMIKNYGERLFTKEYDANWFMKKFGKHFQVPEER
jgi:hypothetical protein